MCETRVPSILGEIKSVFVSVRHELNSDGDSVVKA